MLKIFAVGLALASAFFAFKANQYSELLSYLEDDNILGAALTNSDSFNARMHASYVDLVAHDGATIIPNNTLIEKIESTVSSTKKISSEPLLVDTELKPSLEVFNSVFSKYQEHLDVAVLETKLTGGVLARPTDKLFQFFTRAEAANSRLRLDIVNGLTHTSDAIKAADNIRNQVVEIQNKLMIENLVLAHHFHSQQNVPIGVKQDLDQTILDLTVRWNSLKEELNKGLLKNQGESYALWRLPRTLRAFEDHVFTEYLNDRKQLFEAIDAVSAGERIHLKLLKFNFSNDTDWAIFYVSRVLGLTSDTAFALDGFIEEESGQLLTQEFEMHYSYAQRFAVALLLLFLLSIGKKLSDRKFKR